MTTEIPKASDLEAQVFGINNEKDFSRIALGVYHFQFANNPLYRAFCEVLGRTPDKVRNFLQIPYLPISFFKTHAITTTSFQPALTFKSSGTTGANTSSHYVKDPALYEKSFLQAFRSFFGPVEEFCVIGLLPSYLERGDSSLVYMVDHLIRKSGHPQSGFYLYNFQALSDTLDLLERSGQKTVLFGVTFALLDFARQFPRKLSHTMVVETGGMKGRQKELTRSELHTLLREGLGIDNVYSEYGMTELLSQAYGANGLFHCPPWMKIVLRDETDPLCLLENQNSTGVINVTDLANLYSCSFIATDDLGRMGPGQSFEVLGRLDNSDVRGCSQLVS